MKDINDLHCLDPANFITRLEYAIKQAEKLDAGLVDIKGNRASSNNFKLKPLSRLLREPLDDTPWLVDKMLPLGGTSLDAAKPKVGKTTKGRNLARAVIEGSEFLGRKVLVSGPVLYYALEEKPAEFIGSFRKMGCDTDQIHIHFGMAPQDPVVALTKDIEHYQPKLVIIDPIQRFIRIKDISDYAAVSLIMEPIQELARSNNCHIMLVHHLGKMNREDGDDVLGSTALFGSVDTLLITKKRNDGARTVQTRQRYGEDLEETILAFDKETDSVKVAGSFIERKQQQADQAVLAVMKQELLTEGQIKELVGRDHTETAIAIRRLVESGLIVRTGAGKKGNAFVYAANSEGGAASS